MSCSFSAIGRYQGKRPVEYGLTGAAQRDLAITNSEPPAGKGHVRGAAIVQFNEASDARHDLVDHQVGVPQGGCFQTVVGGVGGGGAYAPIALFVPATIAVIVSTSPSASPISFSESLSILLFWLAPVNQQS